MNQPNFRQSHNERVVLLVDNDAVTLARDARVVSGAGYAVRTARSGLHAQQILARDKVALILTEHLMPGIDGLSLLLLVKKHWPDTRRVIATARPRGELVMRAKVEADARTLIKPVTPYKLITVVKEELDAYGRGN